ncbi:MAG TPA: cation diffusion facilitator family transporter [Clostridiales bacterium]|nr:MAG: Cadmium, cobalt and zinc/H(+)-K(+) antiporter [Firmicutes bacterium ADurb.Bin262]HOU09125.1 cation diffusion facilitator family transporter [Clostridiales bacterium]HQH62065.1 cation diffusion facilitator family transporter [Clostridiales bacterium]HQK73773.1 cation diffusion facilitator family transporter [Clostridiales bacterium]
MPDNHNHSHHHGIEAGEAKGSRLLAVIALNFIITAAQTAAGIFAGSLSLISDSLHNFSDGMAVIISYLALRIAGRGNDKRRTFGYKRATILAALVNSSVLAVISVFLFREAYGRFQHPREVDGGLVIWVALVGLAANALGAWLLHGHSKGDINLKASYLHLISDTLSSVGVVIGGILIYFFRVYWVDPLLTVLIALYVLTQSYKIIKQAFAILMQSVPASLDPEAIAAELCSMEEIENVHHVHIWSLDENNVMFEAHVNVCDMLVSETARTLEKIERLLEAHGIRHVTIQFENGCCPGAGVISAGGPGAPACKKPDCGA